MDWNHLPVAGGLYDQHPRLLEEWSVIFKVKAEHQKQEQARQEQKMQQQKSNLSRRRRR